MKTLTITAHNLEVLKMLQMFGGVSGVGHITFNIANIKMDLAVPVGMEIDNALFAYIESPEYSEDVILSSEDPDWLDHLNTLLDLYRNTLRTDFKFIVSRIKDSIKYAAHEVAMQIGDNGKDIKNCIKISTYVLTFGHYITSPDARRIYKSSNFLGKLKIDVMPIILEQLALAGVDACMKYKEGYDAAKALDEETTAKDNQE